MRKRGKRLYLVLSLMLLLSVLCVLCACSGEKIPQETVSEKASEERQNDETHAASEKTETEKATVQVAGEAISFQAQYIRTGGAFDQPPTLSATVIRSVAELNAYYEENKKTYDLSRRDNYGADFTKGFLDACDKYDDDYFSDHVLLLTYLVEGSGSVRHKVTAMTDDGAGNVIIDIDRLIPEVGTDDMAGWHILVEPQAGWDVPDASCVTVRLSKKQSY